MRPRPCLVWFRDELRLSDHPALHAAARSGAAMVCLYVLDEESRGLSPLARPLGGAARWWLAQSLRALDAGLRAVGTSLVLRKGRQRRSLPSWPVAGHFERFFLVLT